MAETKPTIEEERLPKSPKRNPRDNLNASGSNVALFTVAGRRLDAMTNLPHRDQLRDYLSFNERLKEHYEEYREKLRATLDKFREAARGTTIEQNAEALYQDFSTNFDVTILKLFQIVGLNENPEVVERVLQNKTIPEIMPAELPFYINGKALDDEKPPKILINRNYQAEYSNFRSTIIHEFLHIYLEAFGGENHARNRALNEGITEMLTQEIDVKCRTPYPTETELARLLFIIDRDALMDWYTGGSTEAYKTRLKEKLTTFYDQPQEANNFVEFLFSRQAEIFKRKRETALAIVDFLDSRNESTKIHPRDRDYIANLVNQFISDRIDMANFETEFCKKGKLSPEVLVMILRRKIGMIQFLNEQEKILLDMARNARQRMDKKTRAD